jgi:S-sulfosulfanyl-L-cysteine sulfohydrolase
MRISTSALLLAICLSGAATNTASAGDGKVTLIHTGDFHGHLTPRVNVRLDGTEGRMVGGLARIHALIKQIRARSHNSLLLHTGDTIQGSAEALFTRGQALVDVINDFGVDAFVPGNWDFVYGADRFIELFAGRDSAKPLAPWNVIAANLYYDGEPYAAKTGQRVAPPYLIKNVGGVKVGVLGLTTDRGPQIVGRAVTKGFRFLKNTSEELDAETARQVAELRDVQKVDIVVLMSEMGLANNIRLTEKIPGIDVALSSDMHEETKKAVVSKSGAVLIEEGQDGTMVGELVLHVKDRRVAKWDFKPHRIIDGMPEDPATAARIAEIRKPYLSGPAFVEHVNPFNGAKLKRPLDEVVGETAKPLHRSNFSSDSVPAVIEGSSHDFLTDAFRSVTGAQIASIRGFRFGTHVAVGPIKLEDLYHFVPIGPQIAVGTVSGEQLKNQIENNANGSLAPDVSKWTGGWLWAYSGVTMDFDVYQAAGQRASNILVGAAPWDAKSQYSYASYWFSTDPDALNTIPAKDIKVYKGDDGSPMDATEVVVKYLESLPGHKADTELGRYKLTKPLPKPAFDNPEIQPLRGARE